jgi:hypothetical protein
MVRQVAQKPKTANKTKEIACSGKVFDGCIGVSSLG